MTFKPQNALVWAEIPVSDLGKAMKFYSEVFKYDLDIDDSGPNPTSMIPTADGQGTAGHLYPGTPGSNGNGPTIHLAVPDKLEDATARFKDAGGQVLTEEPVTIPVGRFTYGIDPDGNSIGLFERS